MSDFVYLASQSPRRRQLLEQLGVRYELLLPDPHEDSEGLEAVLPGEPPATYVRRVTALKLDAAVDRLRRRWNQSRGRPDSAVARAETARASFDSASFAETEKVTRYGFDPDQLRAEFLAAARQGWPLVLIGQVLIGVGVLLSLWA